LSPAADYFWHYTDVHYDPTYETTQESCNVNVSDSPFGSYECDSPWRLVVSSVNAMKRIGPKPAFIVWSGYGCFSAVLADVQRIKRSFADKKLHKHNV